MILFSIAVEFCSSLMNYKKTKEEQWWEIKKCFNCFGIRCAIISIYKEIIIFYDIRITFIIKNSFLYLIEKIGIIFTL